MESETILLAKFEWQKLHSIYITTLTSVNKIIIILYKHKNLFHTTDCFLLVEPVQDVIEYLQINLHVRQ